jgi:hypothetical protein
MRRSEWNCRSGNSAILGLIAHRFCRLWHNLTVALTEFVFTPGSGPAQIELFEK